MLDRIIRFSIEQRWLVMFAVLVIALLGIFNFTRLPIDAVPDITNVQVQINTEAPGMSPLEVEKQITFALETALAGTPGVSYIRSLSRYGLSQITVVFEEGTDIYFARQLIASRTSEAKDNLPPTVGEPILSPVATGLGEIYMWTVEADSGAVNEKGMPYSPADLRTVQDWIVKPQLRNVPGVTEVNTTGGYEKQYHVTPFPSRLISYGLTFRDILEALAANNASVGAGYIEHKGEQYLIRVPGLVSSEEDIRNIVIGENAGTPIYIRDVAEVAIGKELRTGAATQNGKEVVLGTVFMLMGENSRTVSTRVDERMVEVNKTLPPGVRAKTVYNRTDLVNATLRTVRNNLTEGAILVIAVLFALLGNIRAALLVAMVIPLSMLFAITGMVSNRISGNLMSLGAIDFGIIIDGAVVMVENIIRRFAERQHSLGRLLTRDERLDEAFVSASEVAKPTLFGVAIIMIVYLPILTLGGIEGKMFLPMAQTVLLALGGALLLTFTFIPAGIALFLRGRVAEKENPIMRFFKSAYRPVLLRALQWHRLVLVAGVVLLGLSGLVATRLGSEFIPSLDEGDIAVQALRIPSTSLSQSLIMQEAVEKSLVEFPEVERVFARVGTSEIATDPMPPSISDAYVMLKPRKEWPEPDKPKSQLVEEMEETLSHLPGNSYEISQPIQLRFNELIAGVRSDVAVKLFGDNLDTLLDRARLVAQTLSAVDGAADVKVEQVTGLPILTVNLDRTELARLGLNVTQVQDVVEIAIGGKSAGQVYEGDKRFELIVQLPEEIRRDVEALEFLPIPLPPHKESLLRLTASSAIDGSGSGRTGYVPLGAIATIEVVEGPNQISRENGKRRVVVQTNVRGRDIGSFVSDAEVQIKTNVQLPSGYWITWGGQFENLIEAQRRLSIVVPVSLVLIFVLLFTSYQSVKDALIIFTGVPLALTGGIFALWVTGIPFSISAGVGFIALSGIAVLNGIVMVSFFRKKLLEGVSIHDAIYEGALIRLRPVLMTALVASLGFVPMAIATGSGAEVQRPLATVVIGGILSSTLLTLVLLPALYIGLHSKASSKKN